MKKENRKMAQQRRAEERRKKEFRKKLSKILVIGVPSLAVLALVIVLIVDGVTNNSGEDQPNSTDTEASSETSGSSGSSDTDSQDTGSSYSTDSSLTVEDGDTVNIDYVGSIDGVEFDGGNTQGMGTDLVIGSGSYIDDFEDQLIGAHPGDQVDVYVTFPEDYGVEELNGKEALFQVTVNGIYE
ncbi:FKBP-type peptidyl-prolyl cis-trans isomerase [[Ruminococcus] torques]|uniref:FKBP-type peptidyl-prolyl cis-trans isomerase n=1 Tax=[Ruminococcus] torques TaxID=33039 RepID=UPI002F4125BF